MVVPVGKKVRLLITSNDVIHGWYVPQVGINQHGIPGFIKDAWFTIEKAGTYRGQCSQICGKEHGFMPIVVVAKPQAEYDAWVKEAKAKMPPPPTAPQEAPAAGAAPPAQVAAADAKKKWTMDELKSAGEKLYAANCAACHQPTGKGVPPAFTALGIRAELFQPGLQFFDPEFFNSLTTVHGLVMVFGAIMPAFVGFANWLVPLHVGAADMAFPRMNNWSFWLLIPAALLLIGSFFVPGGAAGSGWTLYPPLIIQQGMAIDMTILAIHMLGASSIMGSINIITTILNMRAPGMTLMRIPLFVWPWLITAYLLIAVMPVVAGAVTMLLTDRHFGTSFFNAAAAGDP